MKKINFYLLVLLVVGISTSCSNTPEDVLQKAYSCLIDCNFEKMSDYFVVDTLSPLSSTEKDMFVNLMSDSYALLSIASATLAKCEVNDSLGKGEWEMNTVSTDGDIIEENGVLLKDTNGDWKIAPFASEDLSSENLSKELMPNVRYALAKIIASRGNSKYQYYMVDYSIKRNKKDDANDYLKKAANGGYPLAQYSYAEMLRGNGDVNAAFEWMQKAANQKYEKAQKDISYYYCNGWGIEQDYEKSKAIAEEFAKKGDADMQGSLAWHYENRKGLSKDELAVANEKAIEWYTKSAEQGNMKALLQLGFIYYNKRNYNKAIEMLTIAAEQGNVTAQFNLGVIYHEKRNYKKALEWYTKAAEQGDPSAQNNLGVMYENGQGTSRNFENALYWFKMAANQGNAVAESNFNRLSRR